MFEKAVQLNERDPRVWRNLGDAYYWSGERSKAAPAYQHAANLLTSQLKISPKDPKLLMELALCKSMLGKQKEALELIGSAAQYSPSDPELQFRSAEIYEQGGDHVKAIEKLQRAVSMGYSLADVRRDPTFEQLRGDRRYKQLVEEVPPQPAAK